MIQKYQCHQLNLGDRVSLQQMSKHLHLQSSIGIRDFAFRGDRKAFNLLRKSRGWKQFVNNAMVKPD